FFRGKMEISLPDEGIYGVVDHAVENVGNSSGFRKIKLKLRNATPRGDGIEQMATTGKLRAVVKFHRNLCYMADLSGEYGAPGKSWNACRGADEEIIVSDELNAPADINSPPESPAPSLIFNFPTPVPINATDMYLQVVYRGPLGDEGDAVVAATKDITEPQYVVFTDLKEQVYYSLISGIVQQNSGHYTWQQAYCDAPAVPSYPYATCKSQFRQSAYMRFSQPTLFNTADPIGSFNPTVTVPELPVSGYSRIAFLTDANATRNEYLLTKEWNDGVIYGANGSYGSNLVPALLSGATTLTQVDPATNLLTPVPYRLARGIYVGPGAYSILTSGDVVDPPPLLPLRPVSIDSQFLASP
ncbi:MAG: hypothetical protein ABIO63_04245, partial [Casimicrobiaceae bacterium]